MDTDRMASINIGGVDYPLVLSYRATKEIIKRYGSLEDFGERLANSGDAEAMDNLDWLILLLAREGVGLYNYYNPHSPLDPLTEEMYGLLADPAELNTYAAAVNKAVENGTKRYIKSAGPPKNKRGAGKR